MKHLISKPVLILIILISTLQINAQISISSNDMASPGDIIHTSTGLNLDFINYQETGENFTWDFSQLTVISQTSDTFIGFFDVSPIYQFFFLGASNLVKKDNNTMPIPNFPITKQYSFLQKSNNSYNNIGVGYTISGIPIPLRYSTPDVLYTFPMEYGDTGSSYAEYSIGMPNIGYIGKEISRSNAVDGWGTLTTPYGTFDVLRLKSEIVQFDTLYIDSLGFGIPLHREYTDYSWIGIGQKIPLLHISSSLGGAFVTYIDSLRSPSAINSPIDFIGKNISVFPNPTTDVINISFDLPSASDIIIEMYTYGGVKLADKKLVKLSNGVWDSKISLREFGLKNGIYLLKITSDKQMVARRIILY
ncbi:MAG: T9SS type A sorting domain-containing protein [Bacteroidota bacterium]